MRRFMFGESSDAKVPKTGSKGGFIGFEKLSKEEHEAKQKLLSVKYQDEKIVQNARKERANELRVKWECVDASVFKKGRGPETFVYKWKKGLQDLAVQMTLGTPRFVETTLGTPRLCPLCAQPSYCNLKNLKM